MAATAKRIALSSLLPKTTVYPPRTSRPSSPAARASGFFGHVPACLGFREPQLGRYGAFDLSEASRLRASRRSFSGLRIYGTYLFVYARRFNASVERHSFPTSSLLHPGAFGAEGAKSV